MAAFLDSVKKFWQGNRIPTLRPLLRTSAPPSAVQRNADLYHATLRYEAMLSSVGEGLIAADRNGRIIFMNPAAERMLGWPFSGIRLKLWIDFIKVQAESGKDIAMDDHPVFQALMLRKTVSAVDYYYVRKDRTRFPASINASPVLLEGSLIGAIIIFRDITREKEIDRAKSEFVSLASHQLRTPLAAISWSAEILSTGDAGHMTPKQQEYLEEIRIGAKRMAELVNTLLDVSRIELGTFGCNPAPINASSLSLEVLGELRHDIAAKKLVIKEMYGAGIEHAVLDPHMLRIVFQNLYSNAVKYSQEKEIIAIVLKKEAGNFIVEVSDTGIGIPAHQQANIFTKLFRADNAKLMDPHGNGLGLYIVKSIVGNAGGTVRFVSEEGKGTVFYVSMPLK